MWKWFEKVYMKENRNKLQMWILFFKKKNNTPIQKIPIINEDIDFIFFYLKARIVEKKENPNKPKVSNFMKSVKSISRIKEYIWEI